MQNLKPIPVILDGDPGHDDAIAWTLAKASPQLRVLAVTSVCGNQTIEKTTYNAQRVCTLLGLRVPIGKGRPRPLLEKPMNAPSVHGESGLDGPALPEPAFPVSGLSAAELMYWVVTSDEGTQMMAEQFGPCPFKNAKTPENVFFAQAADYTNKGNYIVTWAFNFTPAVDDWRAAVVDALTQYTAGTGKWDAVKSAFVDGWATQYANENG